MSIQATAGVIHQIDKQAHQKQPSKLTLRQSLHKSDGMLNKLMTLFEETLQEKGRGSSVCDAFDVSHTLANILVQHRDQWDDGSINYLTLSQKLMKGLHHHIQQSQMTTGEHTPILFYKKDGVNYLLIALISLSDYLNIDSSNGEILDVTAIDTRSLKVALRVNVDLLFAHEAMPSDEQSDLEPYIQWLQQSRSTKLQDYIQDFIPTLARIDDTKNTEKLMTAIDSYLQSEDFSKHKEKADDLREKLVSLLVDKSNTKSAVHVENDIDPLCEDFIKDHQLSAKTFAEHRKANNITIDSVFTPLKKTVEKHRKFIIKLEEDMKISGYQKHLGNKCKIITENQKEYLKIEVTKQSAKSIKSDYPRIIEPDS